MNKHLTFLPSPGAEDSAPKFKGPVYCWQLCCEAFSHTHLCKSHKVFQQKGRLHWKGLIFFRLQDKKDVFHWFCHQFPGENLQPVSGLSQNGKRATWAGSHLPTRVLGVWGRVPWLPPDHRTWKGQGEAGHRVPEAGNQSLPMLDAHSHAEFLQSAT